MHLPNDTLLQGGKYRITRFIASGGFGCTYEGLHVALGKRIAIKEFFVGEYCDRDTVTGSVSVASDKMVDTIANLKRKFFNEAKALSRLHHQGIVSVSDSFEENGTAYYVMEYIDGESLSDLVKVSGSLPEVRALEIMGKVAEAVEYVHSNGLLHLDIKPANIMLSAEGEPILIDFGVAKVYDRDDGVQSLTISGFTPGYAALEQISGDSDMLSEATDVYAMGATLYYLVTGETPPKAVLLSSGKATLSLPPSVSGRCSSAITKAMSQIAASRPQSARAFRTLLEGGADAPAVTRVVVARPLNPQLPATEKPKSTNRVTIGVAIAVSALIILVGGLVIFGRGEKVAPPQAEVLVDSTLRWDAKTQSITYAEKAYKMVAVDGGMFSMGSTGPLAEGALAGEFPVHPVTLSGYSIGESEVPQWLWTAVMDSNPSKWQGDELPVEQVNVKDCEEFIARLNEITGQTFSLPTEAQWEYAAREGRDGNNLIYSGSDDLDEVAWYEGNSDGRTHPVKGKKPNALGLYDMTGNVWEWCSDWKGAYPDYAVTNPECTTVSTYHVNRSGSWGGIARSCRVSCRNYYRPDYRDSFLGLRLAKN